MKSLALVAGASSVAAVVVPWMKWPVPSFEIPLVTDSDEYKCDKPPVLDPASDGLPSATDLFLGKDALLKQVERHQAIVQVPSICFDDLGDFDTDERWKPFYDLHDAFEKTYPVIHKRAKLEKINTFGLLYTIQGSDSSLKPTLLMGHQDVVPVADYSTWEYPPFDAHYDGEWLWGRGSLDDKNSVTAIMSAVETLLSNKDWTPRRTILLAFGFDEECSGYKGAGIIGETLTERYGDNGLAIILDEGGSGMITVDDTLYVLPATSEKGHVDIWLTLHVNGGHSSIPLPHTGIGIISEMVAALESHPYEPKLEKSSPLYSYLVCTARYTPQVVPGLGDLLEKGDLETIAHTLGQERIARFLLTTSQAVDFIEGGQKINALPEVTKVGVNYRVSAHDSIPLVQHNIVKYINEVVKKYNISVSAFEGDERYEDYVKKNNLEDLSASDDVFDQGYNGKLVIEATEDSEPAPISPVTGQVWDVFAGSVQHTFREDGNVVPTGQLMTGNTDTRHYLNLSPNIYRFVPVRLGTVVNAHTVDEGVNMNNHMEILSFYYDFIRNFDAATFNGEDGELSIPGEL